MFDVVKFGTYSEFLNTALHRISFEIHHHKPIDLIILRFFFFFLDVYDAIKTHLPGLRQE